MGGLSEILKGAAPVIGMINPIAGAAVGAAGLFTQKKPKAAAADNSSAFLNYDISALDPSFKYPAGYSPSTVKPIIIGDLPQYTGIPTVGDLPNTPAYFQGPTWGENAAQTALGDARGFLSAITNPDDPLNKRVAEAETRVVRGDFLRNLRDMQSLDRKARSMGRRGVFGDERGDENVARTLLENASSSMNQGRLNAMDTLRRGYEGSTNLASQFGNLGQFERQRQRDYQTDLETAIGNARGDSLTRMGLAREDTLRNIQTQREDELLRNEQMRADLASALTRADPQRASMAASQNDLAARRAGQDSAMYSGISTLLSNAAGNYRASSGGSAPWRDIGDAMPWKG